MAEPKLLDASELDYEAYADHQKECYREILEKTGVSDDYMIPHHYQWQYHPPVGSAKIAAVFDGSQIVASNAMFPVLIRDGGTIVKGWQSLDTATRPSHRGKGYFVACLKVLISSLAQNEIFFGFPNENSVKGFFNVGWKENLVVTTWVNPLSMPFGSDKRVMQVEEFDGRQDTLAERTAIAGAPVMDHNTSYMNWRYASHPYNKYALFVHGDEGVGVVREAEVMGRTIALVMELWGTRADVRRRLMGRMAKWAVERKRMMVFLSSGMRAGEGFASGFVAAPAFLLPKRQVLAMLTTGGEADRIGREKWHVQTGDWDVF
jgi:hypothetical protein